MDSMLSRWEGHSGGMHAALQQHHCMADAHPSNANQVLDVMGLAVDVRVLGHEWRCSVMPASTPLVKLGSSISS